MLKMKYLLAAALVVLCAVLTAGPAYAADGWAAGEQTFPVGVAWDQADDVAIQALNNGTTTWNANYDLLSVDGTTAAATPVDRWGLTATDDVASYGYTVPPGEDWPAEFEIVAPPITGTFQCGWTMENTGVPFLTDLASANVTVSRFPDILPGAGGAWAAKQIEACAGRVPAIVQGFGDGTYRPRLVVSRDAIAVFIRRAMGIPQLFPAEATFDDVPLDYWASPDIEALLDAGVVGGFQGGGYRPTVSVRRDAMAVFISNAENYTIPTDGELEARTDLFDDVPVGYWADGEIYACVDNGVVSGYSATLYQPGWTVSRDQMAVFIHRAFIMPTDVPVIVGGPALTEINPTTATYDGWTSVDTNPGYAYVAFAAGKTWDVDFDFRDAATPTVPGTVLSVTAANGVTSLYAYASTLLPGLALGDYVMVTFVEGVELPRRVDFSIVAG